MPVKKPTVADKKFGLLLKTLLSEKVAQADIDFIKELPPGSLFIDVREENEYAVSSIEGALLIPFSKFEIELINNISIDSIVVVFCSVGVRSEKICKKLVKAGYGRVYNLYGGIFEWVNRGLPVITKNGHTANRIHGFSRFWGVWVAGIEKVYN